MSTRIENRIVSMQFDNSNFDSKVSASMGIIDKLKLKLNFSGATKGLESISTAASKTNLSPIGKSAEEVQLKISAMAIYSITALTRIANAAITAGTQMVKSLTIEPISMGFSEYETKMNAIQTIMTNTASKGTTMSQVTEVIDELNTYADKTIYNFAEMTRNIGTFTAAGVGLEESAAAIQGIANLAAASGSNSQQASTAMYQLSQALATGTVKLMDWNSVVNAGMGGELFQNALKDTAREMGVAVDDIIEKNGSFRDSLQEGWLSADILNTTLMKFTKEGAAEYAQSMVESGKYTQEQADALLEQSVMMEDAATKVKTFTQLMSTLQEGVQSGWGKTFELILGDFLDARDFFSDVSSLLGDMLSKTSDSRNDLIAEAFNEQSVTISDWEKLVAASGEATDVFKNNIISAAKENGISIDSMISEYGSFEKSLESGWLKADTFNKAISMSAGVIGENTEEMQNFEGIVNDVIMGLYGNGAERMRELTQAGWDYNEVQGMVNDLLLRGESNFEKLTAAELTNLGYTEDQIKAWDAFKSSVEETGTPLNDMIQQLDLVSGRTLFQDSILNGIKAFIKLTETVKKSWSEVFPPMTADQLYSILEAVNKFTEGLILTDKEAEYLGRTLKGVFSIVGIFKDILVEIAKFGLGLFNVNLENSLENTLKFTAGIGDNITSFREWLKSTDAIGKSLDFVLQLLSPFLNFLKNIASELLSIDSSTDAFDKLQNGVKSASDMIKDTFATGTIDADKLKTSVASIGTGGFQVLRDEATSAKDNVGGSFDDISKKMNSFFDDFAKKTENLDMGDAIALGITGAFGVGMAKGFVELSRVIGIFETLADGVKGANNIVKGIGSALDNLSDVMKVFAKKQQAEMVYTYAKAIAVLAASLFLVSLIDSKKLISSIQAIGLLAVILMGMAAGLRVLTGTTDLKSATVGISTIIGIAAGVVLLAIAMKVLNSMSPIELFTSFTYVLALLSTIVLAIIALSKFAPNAISGGATILAMTVGIFILIQAIKQIADMNPDKLAKAIQDIGVIMALLTTVLMIISYSGPKALSAAGAILIITLALVGIIAVIKLVQTVSFKEAITGMLFIGTFLTLFSGVMIAVSKTSNNIAKGGAAILMMSVAIGILAITMKVLGTISIGDTIKGLAVITACMAIFSAVIVFSKFAGREAMKAGVMILAMSVAIGLLVGAIAALTLLDPAKVAYATGIILQIMTMFGLIIAASGLSKNAAKTITSISIAIAAITASVILLALLPTDDLDKSVNAVLKIMTTLTLMAVVISAIPSTMVNTSVKTVIIMLALLAGVSFILYTLSDLGDPSALIATSTSLMMLMLSLSATLIVMALVGTMVGPATVGALLFMAFIVVFGALLIGIGALFEKIEGLESMFDTGIRILIKMGEGLGTAIGSFVGGILSGVTNQLPTVADDLSLFMVKLTPFLLGLEMIDEGKVKAAVGIAQIILALTAADLLSGIASFLTGGADFGQFGEQLVAYGKSLKAFAKEVEGLDTTYITTAVEASKGIVELAQTIPNSGGLLGKFMGENTFAELQIGLVDFGKALVKFGDAVNGVNVESINIAVEATKGIVEVANSIPNSGGWLGKLAGDNTFSELEKGLVDYGSSLKAFGDEVEGTKVEAILKSIEASKAIADVANTIPNSGGFVSVFTGDNDFGTLGDNLKSYGKSLVSYSDSVLGLNTEAIETSLTATKSIVELGNSIPDTGFFGGNNDSFKDLGKDLKSFGDSLGDYSESIAGVAFNNVTKSGTVLKSLLDSMASVNDSNLQMDNAGDAIKTIGKAIEDYSERLEDVSVDSISRSITSIQKLVNSLNGTSELSYDSVSTFVKAIEDIGDVFSDGLSFDSMNVSGIQNGVNSFINTIKSGITTGMPNISNTITTSMSTALSLGIASTRPMLMIHGGSIVSGLGMGITTNTHLLSTAIRTMLSGINVQISAQSALMNTSGMLLVRQLSSGISSSSSIVSVAFSSLVNSAVRIINSKATTFRASGIAIARQLATGITSGTSSISSAMSSISRTALNSISASSASYRTVGRTISINIANGINSGASSVYSSTRAISRGILSSLSISTYTSGRNVAVGLSNGIKLNAYIAVSAARSMAQRVANAINSALDINSPSGVAEASGKWVGPGLANGITKGATSAIQAAMKMGKDVGSRLNNELELVAKTTDNILNDVTPVISPVLDMSNVINGANQMNGLFENQELSFNGTASNISGVDNKLNQANDAAYSDSHDTYEINVITQATDAEGIVAEINNQLTNITNGVIDKVTQKITSQQKARG